MSYKKQRDWSNFKPYRPTIDADHEHYKKEYEYYSIKFRDSLRLGEWPNHEIRNGYDRAKELLCRYLDSKGMTMPLPDLKRMRNLKLKELQAR